MGNKKHSLCTMRIMASEAKKRLGSNNYADEYVDFVPLKGVTPSEREVYLKLKVMLENGEEINNPLQQLADKKKLENMTHEEKQRYIIQLSADYVSMKKLFNENKRVRAKSE